MQEIKFRGRRVDNGKWAYGYYFKSWDKTFVLWGTVNGVPNMVEVIPETVGQFTGLKDKNGVEIYEGDNLFDEYDEESYVVEFENGVFVATGDGFTVDLFEVVKSCSLIGNIHDQKENEE